MSIHKLFKCPQYRGVFILWSWDATLLPTMYCSYTITNRMYSFRVVRHMKIGLEEGPYGVKDKFRIHMYTDKKVLIGRKLVSSTLIKEKNKEV